MSKTVLCPSRFFACSKSGRSDNMDNARLGRQCGQLNTGGGCGKIDYPIGLAQQIQRIMAGFQAKFLTSGEHAQIFALRSAVGGF